MAKSIRSKVKRSFRSKKRQAGVYAAAEAARLHRLNAKLSSLVSKDNENTDADVDPSPVDDEQTNVDDSMNVASNSSPQNHISTHGPRNSRRERWRAAKGLDKVPKRGGMNRQGGLAARRKPGRPSRRR